MKKTEENNRMIAEFMGMQLTNIGWFDNEDALKLPNTNDNTFDNLLFHTSWDWLMPVVSKCKMLSTNDNEYWEAIYYSLEEIDIHKTYQAVCQFIEWYNENK